MMHDLADSILPTESLIGKSRLPLREAKILYSECKVIINIENAVKKLCRLLIH